MQLEKFTPENSAEIERKRVRLLTPSGACSAPFGGGEQGTPTRLLASCTGRKRALSPQTSELAGNLTRFRSKSVSRWRHSTTYEPDEKYRCGMVSLTPSPVYSRSLSHPLCSLFLMRDVVETFHNASSLSQSVPLMTPSRILPLHASNH